MRSAVRATAILGSGSAVSLIVGLASSKFLALILGPAGVGNLGLFQNLLGLAALTVGLGLSTSLVRFGAEAIEQRGAQGIAALVRAGWCLSLTASVLATLVLVVFRSAVGQALLGAQAQLGEALALGVALTFTLGSNLQLGILNAGRRVGSLARVTALNSALAAGSTVMLAVVMGRAGAPFGLAIGAGAGWAYSRWELRKALPIRQQRVSLRETFAAGRMLVGFGVPYTASLLVGYGVQLVLPAMVVHLLGNEAVGQYRAATAVSVTYLGFLLTAMGQDFYPRVAATGDAPGLCKLVNEQQRLVAAIGFPVVIGFLGIAPIVVPLVYSSQFLPAIGVLQWQLLADILKFISWTMAMVVLSRGGLTYFITEFSSGIVMLGSAWLGAKMSGLPGLGFAFVVTYLAYSLVVWGVVRRLIGFRWEVGNIIQAATALTLGAGLISMPVVGIDGIRAPAGIAFAVLIAYQNRGLWQSLGLGAAFRRKLGRL